MKRLTPSLMSSATLALREYRELDSSDTHDFHQVVIGLTGRMAISLDGKVLRHGRVGQRNGCVIPAGVRHDYRGDGPNRQVVLDVPTATPGSRNVGAVFAREAFFTLDAALLTLIRRVSASASDAMALTMADAGVRDVLDALAQRLAAMRPGARKAHLDLPAVEALLHNDLAAPLDTATLARHAGMSPRHFHQCFIAATGETPHRHLMRLRLARAAEWIAADTASLADIALAVGFADQSALTHAFRQHFGAPPAAWRTRLRSANVQ